MSDPARGFERLGGCEALEFLTGRVLDEAASTALPHYLIDGLENVVREDHMGTSHEFPFASPSVGPSLAGCGIAPRSGAHCHDEVIVQNARRQRGVAQPGSAHPLGG